MRRNPLAAVIALSSFYIYYLIRETGHLICCLMLDRDTYTMTVFRILPRVIPVAQAAELTRTEGALIILSGPIAALMSGYILLLVLMRWTKLRPQLLRLLLGFVCYLSLALDPIYYAVTSILRQGGEPEDVALLTGFPAAMIAGIAVLTLIINVTMVRKKVVPIIKV